MLSLGINLNFPPSGITGYILLDLKSAKNYESFKLLSDYKSYIESVLSILETLLIFYFY